MNVFELSKDWFDFCFENPEKVSTNHTALYFFIIEHCNRLGWKEKFGLPTEMAKEALGIKNYKTFSKAFNDIVEWGFVKVFQKSKNQFSANIVGLVKNTKANTKALSKASLLHVQKQVQRTVGIELPDNQEPNNQLTKQTYADDVSMFVHEFEKLVQDHGLEKTEWMIRELSNYKGSKGKKYKSDYKAILTWVVSKAEKEFKPKAQKSGGSISPKSYHTPEAYYSECVRLSISPVNYWTDEKMSPSEIDEEFRKNKIGKYQYA